MKKRGVAIAAVVAAVAVAAVGIFSGGNVPKYIFGVDFGWGGPSVGAMQAAGAKFGVSYLSYDYSKNWQPDQVRAYRAAGIATVNVWETSANRATQGFSAGQSDARAAVSQAAALGEPSNRPIYYAVDCDCSGGQVASYFDGVNSVEGVARTGAYAGFYPIQSLFNTGRITYGWQTYAWSGGQWDSRAQLRQYSNGHLVGGRDTDYNQGTRADYGQTLYASVPPPPPPDPLAILDKTVRHFPHKVTASEYNSVKTWDRVGCRNPVRRSICKSSHYNLVLLRDRLYHIAWTRPAPHPVSFGTGLPNWQDHRGARYTIISKRLRG